MLKDVNALSECDPRFKTMVRIDPNTGAHRAMRIDDLHELVRPLGLSSAVPADIRAQFDTARNVLVYSWFVYEMATVAEQQSYMTVEMALRHHIRAQGGDPSKAGGLQNLVDIALKHKWLRRTDFEIPSPFNGEETVLQFELIRLLRNELSHGHVHLLPDGSLNMMRLCAEVIDKIFATPRNQNKDAA